MAATKEAGRGRPLRGVVGAEPVGLLSRGIPLLLVRDWRLEEVEPLMVGLT